MASRLQDPADVRQVANRLEMAAALFVAGPRGIEVGEPEVHVADALRHRREPCRGQSAMRLSVRTASNATSAPA